LRLLEGSYKVTAQIHEALVDAVYHPNARLREGLALRGYDYVSASMDSSDGLAWSLHELGRMSRVGFVIDKLPVAPEVKEFALNNGLDAADLVFYGGEEYELVLTIKPDKWEEAKAVIEAVHGQLIPIGKATYDKSIILDLDGKTRIIESRGWEHFKSPI
jgi:thiamine-monophosphate kinase